MARFRLVLAFSLTFLISGYSNPGYAQTRERATDGADPAQPTVPKLNIDSTIANLGDRWIDQSFEHAFRFRNLGDAPLEVTSIESSNGVTARLDPPGPIVPGAEAALRATVKDEQMRPGTFEKTVTVTTNDPRFRQVTLTIRGKTNYFIEATPHAIGFGRLDGNGDRERVANIRNHSDRPVTLTIDESSRHKSFRYQLIETLPGKSWKLYVDTVPPLESGTIRTEIVLKSNHPAQPEIRLGVYAIMPERIAVTPRVIAPQSSAGTGDAPPLSHVLSIQNNGPTEVRVAGVSCSDPRVVTKLFEIRPGRRYRAVVQLPPDYSPPDNGAEIIIKTDDGQSPVLTVPIGHSVPRRPPTRQTAKRPTNATKPRRKKPVLETIGKPAPAYSLETVEGIRVSNSELEFHPATILNFFAPNCPHCKRQIPKVEQIRLTYEPLGVRFVNVSEKMRKDFTTDEVLAVLSDLGANLELAIDPGNKVGRQFKATGYPCLIVLRPDGVIDHVVSGNKRDIDQVVSAKLDALLKK